MKTWIALGSALWLGFVGGIIIPKTARIAPENDIYSGSSFTHKVTRPPIGGGQMANDPAIEPVLVSLPEQGYPKLVTVRRDIRANQTR
jgi:hypothetical protein